MKDKEISNTKKNIKDSLDELFKKNEKIKSALLKIYKNISDKNNVLNQIKNKAN